MKSEFTVLIAALLLVATVNGEQVRLTQHIVSDTTTQVVGLDRTGSASPAYVPSTWTAYIPGASWIWESPFAANPGSIDTTTFKKSFYIGGTPVSGFLQIAADSTFTATVNNQLVACAQGSDSNNSLLTTQQICEVSSYLQPGLNYLEVLVVNPAMAAPASSSGNPAGLIFKLVTNSILVV